MDWKRLLAYISGSVEQSGNTLPATIRNVHIRLRVIDCCSRETGLKNLAILSSAGRDSVDF